MKSILVSIENYPACLYQNSNIIRVESEGNYGKTITKFYINDLWFLNLSNYGEFCPSGRLDYIKIENVKYNCIINKLFILSIFSERFFY